MNIYYVFGEKLERGRSLRSDGSSPRNAILRGLLFSLLQLHPKNLKSLLGEIRREPFNPFDLTAEIPRAKALGMTVLMVFCLLGEVRRGSFNPFD